MAYIGNTADQQSFTPAVDFFSGNGSTVAFTLSRPVASVAQVQATIENVPQNPGTAFTISGNTITFDGAPASGTNNIYVYYTSPITQVIQPGQGTVGTAQIVDGAVTQAKLAAGAGSQWVTSGANISYTTGNVGIGTNSPSNLLHVAGSAGSTVARFTDGTNGTFLFQFASSESRILDGGGNNIWAYDNSGQNSRFFTNNTERMRITSAGLLQFNSGYGSVATAYGCRAWVNFNGTGTVAIRGSGNVSSITDVQTGVYRLNFITAMPDTNYATTAIGSEGGGAGDKFYGYQASTTQAQFVVYSAGGSLVDNGTCQMAVFR